MITASIELTGLLGDVVFLAIVVAFFGILVGLVKFCDHIVGPDTETDVEPSSATPDDAEVAA